MKKCFIILLCLISILIVMPSNVKAMNSVSDQNNGNGLYILVNGRNRLQNQNVTTTSGGSEYKSDMCSDELRQMLNDAWKIIMYLSPALLILMSSVDFFKAITSGEADKLKKSSSNAMKRTLAFVLLIMLKFILSTVFGWIGLDLCL